jgi:hypothetical protein
MNDFPSPHTWMTRLVRRIPSSSGTRVQSAHIVPCVLEMLDPARPQAHGPGQSVIGP